MQARNRTSRAASLFAAGLAALLMLFSSQANAGGAADYLPADTAMVGSVDFKGLAKTSLYKDLMGMLMADPGAKESMEKLEKATGFNLERDLGTMLVAMPTDIDKSESFVVIADAKLDQKKTLKFIEEEGGKLETAKHGGKTYYVNDGEALYFDGDFILFGTKRGIEGAIDAKGGKGVSKSLKGLMGKVDTKGHLWLAMDLPKSLRKEIASSLPTGGEVTTLVASVDLASGLDAKATLGTSGNDVAKGLAELMTAATKEAGPQLAQLGMDAAVKNMKISASGSDLNVAVKLSSDEFAQLTAMLGMLMGGL